MADLTRTPARPTPEDGVRRTNTICLEPAVYNALTEYVAPLRAKVSEPEATAP